MTTTRKNSAPKVDEASPVRRVIAMIALSGALATSLPFLPASRLSAADNAQLPPPLALAPVWKDTGAEWSGPGEFAGPIPPAPGQYVTMGNLKDGKPESVTTTLLVSRSDDIWIVEFDILTAKGEEIAIQMRVRGEFSAPPGGSGATASESGKRPPFELLAIRKREKNGKVAEVGGVEFNLMKTFINAIFTTGDGRKKKPDYRPGGSQRVPAGTFSSTSIIEDKRSFMGRTWETRSWFNPLVPINGTVKTLSKDGKTASVLIAFGHDGKSRMPEWR